MGNVIKTWDVMIIVCVCAFVSGFVSLVLLRFLLKPFVWFCIIGIFVLILAGGIAAWVRSTQCADDSFSDSASVVTFAPPSLSQVFPEVVPMHVSPAWIPVAGSAPAPPLSVPVSASLQRLAPVDSAQSPSSKRHASSRGRWYCPVPSCRAHCRHSNRGWSSTQ